jgi:hypothetical protein
MINNTHTGRKLELRKTGGIDRKNLELRASKMHAPLVYQA